MPNFSNSSNGFARFFACLTPTSRLENVEPQNSGSAIHSAARSANHPTTRAAQSIASGNTGLMQAAQAQTLPEPCAITGENTPTFNRAEFERSLNVWVNQGGETENRGEAKNRILRALNDANNQPTIINLSNLQLKCLPECIGQLETLETLCCDRNQLTQLPESIGMLTGLKDLYCKHNQLTQLPESIGMLTGLKGLYCNHNQLTQLPESIGMLTGLKDLYCNNNQLIQLPESIGGLRGLEYFNCTDNQLSQLPERIGELTILKDLTCKNNQLSSLPESIGQLTMLRFIDCQNNNLSLLPQSLADLPSACNIDCTNNPLPPVVIETLQRAIEVVRSNSPERGPRIAHSMPRLEQPKEQALLAEIRSWVAESGQDWTVETQAQWQATLGENAIDPRSAQALSSLLARLRVTAHYRLAKQDMQQRVLKVLDQLKTNPEALQSCAAQAVEGTETCDDRIALAFFLMEENLLVQSAKALAIQHPNDPQTANNLMNTAKGLYASELLRNIANEKTKTVVGFLDPTEIVLKYWVKLSQEFNLPCQLHDMIFHNCAVAVTDADIETAKLKLQAAQNDPQAFQTFLVQWAPWQTLLEHRFPDEYSKLNNAYELYCEQTLNDIETLRSEVQDICMRQGHEAEYSDAVLERNTKMNVLRDSIQQKKIELYRTLNARIARV